MKLLYIGDLLNFFKSFVPCLPKFRSMSSPRAHQGPPGAGQALIVKAHCSVKRPLGPAVSGVQPFLYGPEISALQLVDPMLTQ